MTFGGFSTAGAAATRCEGAGSDEGHAPSSTSGPAERDMGNSSATQETSNVPGCRTRWHDRTTDGVAIGLGAHRSRKYFSTIHAGCHSSGFRSKSSNLTSFGFGVVHGERLLVAELLLPGSHQGGQARDLRLVPGLGGEVPRLVGVVPQVEQLAVVDLRVHDELPSRVAHRTHQVAEGEEHGLADLRTLALPERPEVSAGQPVRRLDPGEGADRREEVEEVRERSGGAPGGDAGAGDDERAAHAVLVEALLAQQPVAAQRQAVVGRVDDDRVVRVPRLLQRREDPPDLLVEVGDETVVLAELVADDLAGPGVRREVLVADVLGHAVVERVLGQEVLRERRAIPVVHLPERLRRVSRVVRRGERDVAEERSIAGSRLEEVHRGVGELLAGELLRDPTVDDLAVAHVGDRDLGVVGHAAEKDGFATGKGPDERRLAVVPLAGRECHVTGLAQQLRQEPHPLEVVRDVEPGAPAHEHGPARHAHGAAVRAEAVVAAEAGPAPGEPVEVRRPDVWVAPRRDGVRTLVVGEQEQDVRPRRPLPENLRPAEADTRPDEDGDASALGRTGRVEGSALASMILPLSFPAPETRRLLGRPRSTR